MDQLVASYDNVINKVLEPLSEPTVLAILRMMLIVYGALAAPHLPTMVLKWFDIVPFRIGVIALILWTANRDPATAVLMAIAFYASVNTLNGKKPFEKLTV
jgi:hypothetical protein